jgi:hypothetical protein
LSVFEGVKRKLYLHQRVNTILHYSFVSGPVCSVPVFSSFKRVNNFSTAGSSGFVCRRYFAKNSERIACFSTFFFQAFFLIFFFDLLVRFC